MTTIESNGEYALVSFIAGCRVWYAIRKNDGDIIFCNNDYEYCKSKFDKL